MADTIKSFVWRARRDGLGAEDTWRAAQSLFPHKCCSRGYVVRLRKMFDEGDKITQGFAKFTLRMTR